MLPINLITLPFAGGNKYSYRQYGPECPAYLKMMPFEYPGRGARMREPLLRSMTAITDDLYAQVRSIVDRQRYAIYGHSMGGLAAYLLTHKLLHNHHAPPLALFISGSTAPSARQGEENRKRHLMEKKEFIQEIRDLNGMPDEILANTEMMEYFEPILRADFTATETYVHPDYPPLDLPLTVLNGTEEDMEEEDIRLWQKETLQKADFRKMTGNHFFIYHHIPEIMSIISGQLSKHVKTYQP
jgi:surfactin synthase thioesterase subunit